MVVDPLLLFLLTATALLLLATALGLLALTLSLLLFFFPGLFLFFLFLLLLGLFSSSLSLLLCSSVCLGLICISGVTLFHWECHIITLANSLTTILCQGINQ